MKTIIIYASKHGATKFLAEKIGQEMQVETTSIQDFHQDLISFDKIIIGSCVYAGMMNKQIKVFCSEHKEILMNKKTFVFLSGMTSDDETILKVLNENLKDDFVNGISGYAGLGGMIDMQQLNFMERKIIQMVNKQAHLIENLDRNGTYNMIQEEAVQEFIHQCSL